jgi:rod shape-determining protein MreC
VTGRLNVQYGKVISYFNLARTNEELVKSNEILLNRLSANFESEDTAGYYSADSLSSDTARWVRRFSYHKANVVSNSVAVQNNFIVLSKGSRQGMRRGMGITDPQLGVVGITTEVSTDYTVVMSLLHRDSRISGKLLKSGETGTLIWDGKEANVVTLTNIPKSAKISKGDTVITSGFSTAFPRGMYIGRVMAIYTEKGSSSYRLKLRTSADFNELTYVFVIDDARQEEVNRILERLNKQN